MKPLILTLQAIGPYAERQTVDFRGVLDSGLFGIYGATGSGKSTIFSAMTFALFGEAARAEQHATTLRSDHADPGLLTQVELIFEDGGRIYRVVRQPEQTRPAKRGGGDTLEKHKAWLFDVTGLDLDAVGEHNPGKVVAEHKVTRVDEEIIKILGYGSAQFRQIVLLPQGRFEAFLSADTPERLKILRELFDVSLYRRLTELVKSKADAAEKDVAAARAVCLGRLSAERFGGMEALAHGIVEAADLHRQMLDRAAQQKEAGESATAAYQNAVQTDAQFKEHREAETDLIRIESAHSEMQDVQSRLERARRMQTLADVAAARDGAGRDLADAQRRQTSLADRLEIIETTARTAREAATAWELKAPDCEKLTETLHTFRQYGVVLTASKGLATAAASAALKARDQAAAAQHAKDNLDASVLRKTSLEIALQEAQSKAMQRARLTAEMAELRSRHVEASHFDNLSRKSATAHATLQRARMDDAKAREALLLALKTYEQAERELLQDHAAHLATQLAPGDPCPVCGSQDHPAPARGTAGNDRIDQHYAEAKSELDAARKSSAHAQAQAEITQRACHDNDAALQALRPPPRAASDIAADLQRLTDQLTRLVQTTDPETLKSELVDLEVRISSAATTFEAARASETEAAKASVAAKQSFDDAIAKIPPDLRDATSLSAAIAKLDSAIADHNRHREAAADANRQAGEALAAVRREAELSAEELDRLARQVAERDAAFALRLTQQGLTSDDYQRHKADSADIAALETRISEYAGKRAAARQRLHRASAIIATLDRPDFNALAAARDAAIAAYEEANTTAIRAAARMHQLTTLQADLAEEGQRLDAWEKQTAPLRELAEAFTGRSYQKIDLETFAISTVFDRVLDAANLRLGPMTRGRYNLARETEGKGNARRGLGIAVEDTYTGRQRPTSTLSGGETFIAALALALGLSDVVESAHGSVRLDTIFIDEGFGSLDSDGDSGTLETVLQILHDLVGASRAVGLISHVPLVQQAIPNGFFVIKTPAGSHIEVRN